MEKFYWRFSFEYKTHHTPISPAEMGNDHRRTQRQQSDHSCRGHGIFRRYRSRRSVLFDGLMLARLMIEFGVGVSSEMVYDMKRIDLDYFEGELYN